MSLSRLAATLVHSKRALLVALLGIQGLGLAATGLGTFSDYEDHHTGDLLVYAEASRRVLDGKVPYRDFDIEYPPAALGAFTVPRLLMPKRFDSLTAYSRFFLVVIILCSTALAWTVARSCSVLPDCQDPAGRLLVYAMAVTAIGPFLAWRYDLFPALLTGLALLAYLRSRCGTAGVLLGLGIAAKVYPLVLLPVFWAEALSRRNYASAVRLGIGVCIGVAIAVLPFAVIAPRGLGRMLAYHADRGLEIGSTSAGVGLLLTKFGLTGASIEFRFGAVEAVFPWSGIAGRVLPIVASITVVVIAGLAYRRFRQDLAVNRSTSAALVGYLTLILLAGFVTSKVLSPQYVAWLLPFFPLLPLRHALWVLAAGALTTAIFPWQFSALLDQQAFAITLLNVRNALLVVGGLWLLRDLSGPALRRQSPHMQGYRGAHDGADPRE